MTAVLFSLLPVIGAQATPISAIFTANFVPPNPWNATSLGDLTGTTMQGDFALFYRVGRAGDLVQVNPGPPDIRGIAFGASGATGFVFDLDLGSPAILYLSFTGALVQSNPGPPDMPLFAFASPGTEVGYATAVITPVPEPGTLCY